MTAPRILFEIPDELSTSAIAVGDVNNSGLSELCTGGRDGVLKLYNATNGTDVQFLAQQDLHGSILSIRIADANNDGLMEIIVGRSVSAGEVRGETGTLQVFRYVPSGQLELLAEHPVDSFVTTINVTDVTGDNKNEIMVGGSDSTLRVLKMDNQNNLTEYIRHQLDDMPIAIGTCDVIGDEIEEIVTGNRDKTLRVFKVRDGALEEIEVLELPSPVISVAAGDILGDRKMELGVVTHDGSIRIYRNEESKLELFTKLDNINALSVRIAELNADHMDEVVIATSDFKILFYSLYMAELKQLATIDIGAKILSLSVGDAGGDDRREVLVGVSDRPLKVIEGLYQIIPRFEVAQDSEDSTRLRGKVTVANVTDQPVMGITGKIYHFPKDNMEINPQQLKFDLGPGETKAIDVELEPKAEGTIIVRPIVLMWTDDTGQVRQVTTPETAILVEKDQVAAAPAEVALVSIPATTAEAPMIYEEPSPFTAPSGTGFGEIAVSETAPVEAAAESAVTASEQSQLKAAEDLLDKLFGEDSGLSELDDVSKLMEDAEKSVTEPTAPVIASAVESAMVTEIRTRAKKPPRPGAASDAYSYLFKVMVTGEGAVGKTALVTRYTTGQFQKDYKTTIGSQFAVKLAYISPPEPEFAVGIKIQAWDVAGQARFKAVRKMYYSGAAGLVLVFDVTRRRSFVELQKWVEEADESVGQRIPIICIGNKIDLPDRAIPSDEAKKWAEDQGFYYMESSAKTGIGVSDMFTVIAELMWRETRAQSNSNQASY